MNHVSPMLRVSPREYGPFREARPAKPSCLRRRHNGSACSTETHLFLPSHKAAPAVEVSWYTISMPPANDRERNHAKTGLRVVSAFEATKGLLVLLTGFGILSYIHQDLHLAAERLVRHFHLNPASRFPRIFLDLADHVTDGQLWLMAFAALLYAAVRFVEAYGLWRERRWAEWFGLLAGGLYIPLELYEIAHGVTWPKAVLLIVNAGVVGYLSLILSRAGHLRKQ